MSNKVKIVLIALAAVLIIILVAVTAYLAKQNKTLREKANQTSTVALTVFPSETITATAIKTRTAIELTETITATPGKTSEESIKEAFAIKSGRPVSGISISISKSSDNSAYGMIDFAGEAGGGWFIAAKKDGEWKIVADGNGTIMCTSLEGYDIPSSVVSECYDETKQDLVKR